ncbi:DUF2092 domain-containing protein [Dongia soli]|uniref:DUF2092 domain-containing protein n=1 Tax=Dongia soli TaxID=600628 RepID=A0ABU5EIV0_9PROT|nr:DUF2092 domain-containing protein [Dongia soli]MDY0885288.1 DUF2092 domain-containing protein [Dongia soli]
MPAVIMATSAAFFGLPSRAIAENAPAETASQQQARTILMGMCDYLASQDKFTMSIRAGYDVVQESGQKIEFRQVAKAFIDRPKQMMVASETSSGLKQRIIMDGSTVTVADDGNRLYSQIARDGPLDDNIKYFVRDLKMRLPLAPLFMQQLPAEMKRRIVEIDYVEFDHTLGVPTHHIAVRMASADLQIWIADGDHPVPMRVILTYKEEPGAPQFWADFSDWNFEPQYDTTTFAFVPSEGARKIPFVSKVRVTKGTGDKSGTEGEAQ